MKYVFFLQKVDDSQIKEMGLYVRVVIDFCTLHLLLQKNAYSYNNMKHLFIFVYIYEVF